MVKEGHMGERVLILGGGYAGAYAALGAARARGDASVEIVLVSAEPDLVNRPRLYEPAPGAHLRYPLAPMLERVDAAFQLGRVTAIDVAERRVSLADGSALAWDRLVIALGSQTQRPALPGIERAFDVDTYEAALALDRHLHTLPPGAPVTIIGSGFTGLELATELATRFKVVLVERAPVVAPSLGEGPRATIVRALDALGVDVRLGAEVDRIDGETTVWCGGMVANPLTRTLPADRDVLGRLVTEPSLLVRGLAGVYAAGDVACAMADDEHPALMSCQHAIKLGQFAGHNAMSDLLGQPVLPYRQPVYRMCLDLGAAGAVQTDGWERRVLKSGPEVKAIKREINKVWAALPSATDRDALLAFGEPGTSKYRDGKTT
jgi:NADH:ubiquinone reductase (H+-translocating)